jgi:serine/threonine protein kinase
MDVEESWFIFKEIVKAVQLTHRSGVIHRDLKPDNIFFGNADTNAIKLGDFGHACWAKQYAAGEAGTPNRGTEWYCAPELDAEASPPVLELNAEIPTDKVSLLNQAFLICNILFTDSLLLLVF